MSRLCRKLTFLALTAALFLAAPVAMAGAVASSETAAAARGCGVSASIIEELDADVSGGGMAEADAIALIDSIGAACRDGLPTAPFEDKLEEGRAKRISPVRILPALEAMRNQYGVARGMLSSVGVTDADSVTIMGDGLVKGVPSTTFRAYVEKYGAQPKPQFLNGLTMTSFLSQAGFDYQLTDSILETGFESGSIADQWRYLVRVVLIARKRGIDDVSVAEAARNSLSGGGSLTDLASSLGFTLRDMSGRSISN